MSAALVAVMQSKYIPVMEVVRALLLVWTDPDTLAVLILHFRRTNFMPDDVVREMLSSVYCISLADALCMTGARAVVLDYTFMRHEVFPSPESIYSNFYYLSQVPWEESEDGHIAIAAKSHWRAADGRYLCYVVSVALADVILSLSSDRRSADISVGQVNLVTNADLHVELSEDFLRTMSRIRLTAAFNTRGDTLHVFDTDTSLSHGFGVRIQYEALCA
jgi:hypothetical protein